MVIVNNSKAVKVLKAIGAPNLRLFPGHNSVANEVAGLYFDGNQAANALKKECLSIVDKDGISLEAREEAKKSAEKNERLNKAQRTIKKNNENLAKNAETIESQANTIKDLTARLEKLEKKGKK